MNIAILLMAGFSRRFQQNTKKQFYKIKNEPSFIYPLKALNESKHVDEIFIVINPQDEKQIKEALQKYKFTKLKCLIKGGMSRQDSVYNALFYIKQKYSNCDYVFIHDCARLLLTEQIINDLYDDAKRYKNSVCATQENDSIATVEQGFVTKYQSRRTVHRIYTPQCFEFKKLFECHTRAKEENYRGSNDDASILLNYGYKVHVMVTDSSLIKLTFAKDLKIINSLLDGGIIGDIKENKNDTSKEKGKKGAKKNA